LKNVLGPISYDRELQRQRCKTTRVARCVFLNKNIFFYLLILKNPLVYYNSGVVVVK
jgi:hypothetical protein